MSPQSLFIARCRRVNELKIGLRQTDQLILGDGAAEHARGDLPLPNAATIDVERDAPGL